MPVLKKIDQVLNITGLQQPQSAFLVSKTLQKVARGGTVKIISDSKHYQEILNTVCLKNKYRIVENKKVRGLFHYIIMKN